jgi:hypothetical protein
MAPITFPQPVSTTAPVVPAYLARTTKCGITVARYTNGSFIFEWTKSGIADDTVTYWHVTAEAREARAILTEVVAMAGCPCPCDCADFEIDAAITEAGGLAL